MHSFCYICIPSTIAAEEAVLARDGAIVRLAGLYNANSGPHTFWLKFIKPIEGPADSLRPLLNVRTKAKTKKGVV